MPKLHISNSSNGRTLKTITGVLAHVSLTGVATTIDSHLITVTSTTGIFPGMSIRAKGVPPGSVVNAVISSTTLELFRSAWDAATGVYSHSAANAESTATDTGGTGYALAFDPQALIMNTYVDDTWRNIFRIGNTVTSTIIAGDTTVGSLLGTVPAADGFVVKPTTVTIATGRAEMTAANLVSTDELAATPLKRHDGIPHTSLFVVHTGGMLSVIHEPHTKDITYMPD